MNHWERTYQKDEIRMDRYMTSICVYSAINHEGKALATLNIDVDSDNGHSSTRVTLTPAQMHSIAAALTKHAARIENELAAEAAVIEQKEAA